MAKQKIIKVVDPNAPVRLSVTLRYWQVQELRGKQSTREIIYSIVDAMTTHVTS